MYDRLLVPVDDSDGARAAVAHALGLARGTDATVDVLHVLDAEPFGGRFAADDAVRERADALLADAAGRAGDADVTVETHLVEGKPARRIVEHVDDHDVDLVAMGRHGRRGLRERLLGSVTDRVLRRAACPVLTVRGETVPAVDDVAYGTVLLPTDGSECAAAAAGDAAALAARFGGTVHVVSVLDLQAAGGAFDAGGLSAEFVDRLTAAREADVAQVADLLGDVPVERAVVRGTPHRELGAYATEHGVDLVVMGRHGRSGIAEGLLGSTTARVLRTVDLPVVAVPGDRA